MKLAADREVLLQLDRASPAPLRSQLEQQLRLGIEQGRLVTGSPLPASRALAAELGVSRGVVVEAYEQLIAEGRLIARQGSATRVAMRRAEATRSSPPPRPATCTYRFDFRPGLPDLGRFPRRAWMGCLRRALLDTGAEQLSYPDARGAEAARHALAAYLGRARAVAATADEVVLCSGFTQGVELAARVLRESGVRSIAVEDPCFGGLWRNMNSLGLATRHIPVDANGIVVEHLWESDAQAVVIAPAHQYPTGAALSAERRIELLEWAHARGATIVEDDYDAEFRYDREPTGALQCLAPDRVIYIGTASKTLSPALRLGWIVAPPPLALALARMKRRSDRGAPTLDQLALADFLERGEMDRHLRGARAVYRRRRDRLVAALARALPESRVHGVAAGLHLMVDLPPSIDDVAVVNEAARRSVRVYGARRYASRPAQARPALVLGYGGVDDETIDAGVERITTAIAHCRRTRRAIDETLCEES